MPSVFLSSSLDVTVIVGGMVVFEWFGDDIDVDVGFCTFNDFDIVEIDCSFFADFSIFVSNAVWH